MIYLSLFTWIAFCTFLSVAGVRGDGSEVNLLLSSKKGVNSVYSKGNAKYVTKSNSLERNKRALQNIYLTREKKESQDPMGYLSRLYSDMEFSKNPYLDWSQDMLQSIVDPPLVELYIHKKVPNCASEFNISKIIELVEDDKRQRICPCTCQIASNIKPEVKIANASIASNAPEIPQESAAEALPEQQPPAMSAPVSVAPSQPSVGTTCAAQEEISSQSSELVEATSAASPSQASQVAVVSKAELPPPKSEKAPDASIKTPKIDPSKAAISQKKQDDKTKVKVPPQRTPSVAATRIGPPLSRVSANEPKKPGAMLQPRTGNAPGIRPPGANLQMKNMMKMPQQIANKPLHSKNPELKQPAPKVAMHLNPQDRGKTLNAKQPIANTGWDLGEPGAAYPGVFPY